MPVAASTGYRLRRGVPAAVVGGNPRAARVRILEPYGAMNCWNFSKTQLLIIGAKNRLKCE